MAESVRQALRPLAGLRVLDLSRTFPGPYLSCILAELGADVVKVESPEGGDYLRALAPMVGQHGAAFAALNSGRRSIAIDLKRPSGVELLLGLADRADLMVESFRPGVLERLGLGFEVLEARNAKLILCSITGYGQNGPLREVPGHDLNYLARAGVLSLFGPSDGLPAVPGVQIADLAGGSLTAAVAVLAALLEQRQSGKGRHLDVSMTLGAMALLTAELARRGAADPEPRGLGILTGGRPCYRVYRTKDDRFMALGALEPKFFAAFCEKAGCMHLATSGLASDEEGKRVTGELEELFASRTQQQWSALLAGTDACCEPVQTPEEALGDPGVGARTVAASGVSVLRPNLGAPTESSSDGVPRLGEHGQQVLLDYEVEPELVARAVRERGLVLCESES